MKRAVSILMLALFLVSCGSEAIKQERTEAIKRAREKRASNTAPSSKFVPEAQETNTKFNWKTNQSINPLDDSVTVVAFLNAWQGTGDVPAAVEFGRVAAAPVNTLRQQPHRCQEISVCF